jgi:hypothetical protein
VTGRLADFTGGLNGLPSVRILVEVRLSAWDLVPEADPHDAAGCPRERDAMNTLFNRLLSITALAVAVFAAASAEAQVVYYSALRPVVAAPIAAAPVVAAPAVAAPAYVANYTPAGNYAAVTAYSPPVVAQPAAVAVTSAYAPAAAPVAVTSYYAPTVVNYAPAATVAYSPVVAAPVAPAIVAPVTTYYAPTAVMAPLYRRGLFGGLRPVRSAYYIPY